MHGLLAGIVWGVIGLVAAVAVFAPSSQPVFAKAHNASVTTTASDKTDLSPAISQPVGSVVALQRLTQAQAAGGPNGLVASGVIVADDLVLTAAHTFVDDRPAAGRVLTCRDSWVEASGAVVAADGSRDAVLAGNGHYQRSGDGHGAERDIALLKLRAGQNFRQQPAAELARGVLRKGDSVYFVNYQTMPDGRRRSPYLREVGSNGLAASYTQPAVFRGIVLGLTKQGYNIATNLDERDGRSVDRLLRKGGSGGAVFDGEGRLAGLSVATTSLTPNHSAGELYREYGVSLPDGDYQLSRAQAVSVALVDELQTGLQACH